MSAQPVSFVRVITCDVPKKQLLLNAQQFLQRRSTAVWFRLIATSKRNCSGAAILANGNHQCVYCATRLIEGENATVDHLLPRCLFQSDAIANQKGNRVACCRECNILKGDWHLHPRHLSWQSREAYLATTRRVVLGRRQYRTHKTA